jgi:hypothetical protein
VYFVDRFQRRPKAIHESHEQHEKKPIKENFYGVTVGDAAGEPVAVGDGDDPGDITIVP